LFFRLTNFNYFKKVAGQQGATKIHMFGLKLSDAGQQIIKVLLFLKLKLDFVECWENLRFQ
jgi:hypothetical protein